MADKKSRKNKNQPNNTIAVNRQATHEYFIEERFEAGLVLQGWEVKSLRDGRVQLKESYVLLKRGEAWLSGAHISALLSASTHIKPEAVRSKKLLLHRHELGKLIGSVERKGYTLIPLSMYWKNGRAKLEIGLAKGKQLHDKRATSKERDWQREKARIMKHA
ncbi:trans-translation protein [Candidatus Methylobacter favarea]|uniref:SsrA-binding protein n=1 Tax=Candidatus Methylobacter favarea TaxID=2707345 RepID=A0A8S0W9A8_9GAMM|nr:SsrA-binding protein SmpB [Candidatus Methylobacter favarea]CAA9889834.1 trans-translation protein [Candidatus Methylobacter favarea]